MRGIFWNMRGFGGDIKKRFLREMIMDMKVDFLGLQETMRQQFSKNDLQQICAGRDFHWHFTPARGKSGGILLGVNYTTLDVISHDEGDYHIKMTVQYLKTRFIWDLVVVYGDAQLERKATFLAELSRVFQSSVNPILIGGDFNIIRKASEKNKLGTPGHWSFLFNAILEQAGVRN